MTTTRPPALDRRIRGQDELVQAIPYLLGFHPTESLVLVCLERGRLVVAARMDLADLRRAGTELLEHTVAAARRNNATEFIAVLFTERPDPAARPVGLPPSRHRGQSCPGHGWSPPSGRGPAVLASAARLAGAAVVREAEQVVERSSGVFLDAVLVRSGRYWSYTCDGPCCPVEGHPCSAAPSSYVVQATVDGRTVLPDRAAQEAMLDPLPTARRRALKPTLDAAERVAVAAVLAGRRDRHERATRRAVFAAARACHEPGWVAPPASELARLAVALTTKDTRDAVWYAIEDGRLDGRPLMHEIARRCPPPYNVAPLFLFGWASWRAGNAMLADQAATRALSADREYTAAQLLHSAVVNCLDPRTVPQLRRPRRARRS